MSKKNILYRFSMALMFMCLFYSCMQKEESENSLAGIVEFVARPTNYNGQNVGTKATSVSDFENKIHNCYFLLFNNDGIRTFISEDLGNTLTTQRFSKQQLQQFGGGNLDSYTNSTACFIANVPKDVVEGIKTLEQLNGTVLDIAYSSADVIDIDTEESNKNSFFVVPEFDLDNDENTPSVQCIPMLGMTTCNLKTTDLFQISLKRLFAKISVNLSVTQNLSSFDLLAAHLYNLPTKVNLTEPTDPVSYESSWVKDASAFAVSQIEGTIDDDDIAGGAAGYGSSSYEFYFYAPEYFLQPLASTTKNYGNEKYKPQMYDEAKYPLFIRLFGTYKDQQLLGNNNIEANIKYDLYLGENASTNFTLKRNVHYTNNVIIKGITNNIEGTGETLDCRVEIKTTYDMVEILGQTANCYIIGKDGTYIYPACKGVYKGDLKNIPESLKCTKGTTLKVLKNDSPSRYTISNLTYDQETGEFSFEVTSNTSGGTFVSNDGNVILALIYEENGEEKIEWSWHIWLVSNATWNTDVFEMTPQTYPNGYMMLDRNLGARPTASQKNTAGVVTGLYYKYGHKEPYIDGKYWGGGESASYDWSGTDKAQTDPCPPGYRVPARSVWEHSTSPVAQYSTIYTAFEYWDDVYYPYSRYINGETLAPEQIVKTIKDGVDGFTLEYNVPVVGKKYSGADYVLMRLWEPRKYRNVTYSYVEKEKHGYLWSYERNNTLQYIYVENETSINCEVCVGTVVWETKTWFGMVESATCKSITWGGWSSMSDIASTVGGYSDLKEAVDNDIASKGYKNNSVRYNYSYVPPQDYGLQVRCVKE